MAKSTYSGGAYGENPTSSYKFIKTEVDKEFRYRLVNEEVIAKKTKQLNDDINKSIEARLAKQRDDAIKAANDNYQLALTNLKKQQQEELKVLQELGGIQEDFDKLRQEHADQYAAAEKRYNKELYDAKLAAETLYSGELLKNQDKIGAQHKIHEAQAQQYAIDLAQARYNHLTANQKSLYKKEEANQLRAHQRELVNKRQELQAQLDITTNEEERHRLSIELTETTTELKNIHIAAKQVEQERAALNETLIGAQLTYLSAKEREKVIEDQINEEKELQAELQQKMVELAQKDDQKSKDELLKAQSDYAKSMERAAQAAERLAKSNLEHSKEKAKELAQAKKLGTTQRSADAKARTQGAQDLMKDPEYMKQELQAREDEKEAEKAEKQLESQLQAMEDIQNLGETMKGAMKSVVSDLQNAVESNTKSFYEYQSVISARMQGTGEDFKDVAKSIKTNVGLSGIVSQKEVVNNIKQLTDSGVAYNLELRAFLATTKDSIAQTFEVFNSNLARMIRIQQADTTAARLGMEASLTKLFNQYFSDTSYLSEVFDSVSESILDASAQMTRDQSMEFEYIVQKWLGALYSLGLSQDAVNTIAQGINYLGTGNVEDLNSNDALRTLMAMSVSNAGMDFGQILVDGLDPDGTNLLMKSMIQYLADIASNTSTNQVTKAVYADLFGVSTPDLNVFTNLSSSVDSLFASTQTYNESMNEVSSQLSQVASRMHISQIMDTAFENLQMDFATNIGGNAATYGLWKTLNVVEGLTGGIHIPAFSVMGNMVDLSQFTIEGLGKTALTGLSLMSTLLRGMLSGSLFGTLKLDKWGFDEYTSRGQGITALQKGMKSGVSEQSTLSMVGNSSAEDMKSASMTDATDSAKEDSEITNKDVAQNVDIYEQIRDAIYKDEGTTVLTELVGIRARLDKPFKTEMDALHSLYRKVWRVQARVLGADQSFYSEEVSDTISDQVSTSNAGEETVTIVNLTQDYIDKLQETILGATYKVEVSNLDSLTAPQDSTAQEINSKIEESNNELNSADKLQETLLGATYKVEVVNIDSFTAPNKVQVSNLDSVTAVQDSTAQEINSKIEESNNQLNQELGNQITQTENILNSLVTESPNAPNYSPDESPNSSNYSADESTLINGTDALGQLLSLLSLDRVFKVAFDDSLTEASSSNIFSQLIQGGNTASSTAIIDQIENSSIMDSISELHADVTTVKSTLGITEGGLEGGKVVVTGMSDEMKSYINNAIKTMIAQAFVEKTTAESTSDTTSLMSSLQEVLSLMNLNVTVTNDFFSEFLQKNAFSN